MISVEQKAEIEQYLMEKKIPLDILIEVEDHFLKQIENYVINENISFNAAFDKVKNLWKDDLKTDKYYNGREVAVFVKKISEKKINKILLESVFFTVFVGLAIYFFSLIATKEVFTEIVTYLAFVFLGLPGLHYLLNIKIFSLAKNYKSTKLNVFQNGNFLILVAGLIIVTSASSISVLAGFIYDFYMNSTARGFSYFLILMCVTWFYSFGFLFQIAFVKSAKKIRTFINL